MGIRRPMKFSKPFIAGLTVTLAASSARRMSRWKTARQSRFLLQGGVRGAAWLRRFGHDQDSGSDSGRRDRGEADAETRLERRDGQRQYSTSYELSRSDGYRRRQRGDLERRQTADDFYDEFVLATFLTGSLKPNTMLYFPLVQECEQGGAAGSIFRSRASLRMGIRSRRRQASN